MGVDDTGIRRIIINRPGCSDDTVISLMESSYPYQQDEWMKANAAQASGHLISRIEEVARGSAKGLASDERLRRVKEKFGLRDEDEAAIDALSSTMWWDLEPDSPEAQALLTIFAPMEF